MRFRAQHEGFVDNWQIYHEGLRIAHQEQNRTVAYFNPQTWLAINMASVAGLLQDVSQFVDDE